MPRKKNDPSDFKTPGDRYEENYKHAQECIHDAGLDPADPKAWEQVARFWEVKRPRTASVAYHVAARLWGSRFDFEAGNKAALASTAIEADWYIPEDKC